MIHAAATAPQVVRTAEGLAKLPAGPGRTALVPTMGALHTGHRSLIAAARERADTVVVSIFVNPLQFAPNEDFERYPRSFDADLEVCAAGGADVVFAPATEVMYPGEQVVTIDPGPMGRVLEGEFRPGFFTGVLTGVNKLFQLVRPDVAVFGQKDAQQLAVVRRMVRDLAMPIDIVASPTVREPDGMAVSSRNAYLSTDERRTGLALSKALLAGTDESAHGPSAIRAAARAVLDSAAGSAPPLAADYLALVDPESFTEVEPGYRGPAVLAVAAWVGETRLIDNLALTL